MAEKVEYELSLKDLFTEKLKSIQEATESFDKALEKIKKGAENLGLDVSFMEPVQFIKEGIEKVNQLHEAHQGLADAMQRAGNFSKEAFDKMTEGAAEFSEHVNYNEDDVVKMQTQFESLGKTGEAQMGKLTEAGADVATKLHISLADAGKQLTNAMKDPVAANSLGAKLKIDPATMANIQKLSSEGKTAEAQMKLLDAVQAKVGGSAKDAFNSNPVAQFNKVVGDVQKVFSQAAVGILQALKPALDWFAGALKTAIGEVQSMAKWLAEHERVAKGLGVVIAAVAGAIAGYTLVTQAAAYWQVIKNASTAIGTILQQTQALATGELTAAQWALNVAMEANPMGLIVAGLMAIGAAIYYAYEKSETFHAGLWGLWGRIKAFAAVVKDVFTGLYHAIHGAFSMNPSEIISGLTQVEDSVHGASQRIAEGAKKGYEEGIKDFKEKKEEKITTGTQNGATTETTAQSATGGKGGAPVPAPSKASGTKSITINISINKQIETLNIKTTNLAETASKIQEHVAIALTNAVNQSQVTAGGR
jgi:ferritin-like metal-binding protein YciE